MRTAVGIASIHGSSAFVFRVPTQQRGDVFMCVSSSNYRNDQRTVVEVDSRKFLALWRSEPFSIHRDVSEGSPNAWMRDRKIGRAHV